MKNMKSRTLLYDAKLVNQNLELDYLSNSIDYENFNSPETEFIVKAYHIGRIDLISYEVYGSPYYWWLIADRNNILSVKDELYVGQRLLIPALTDYFDFYNKTVKVSNLNNLNFSKRKIEVK